MRRLARWASHGIESFVVAWSAAWAPVRGTCPAVIGSGRAHHVRCAHSRDWSSCSWPSSSRAPERASARRGCSNDRGRRLGGPASVCASCSSRRLSVDRAVRSLATIAYLRAYAPASTSCTAIPGSVLLARPPTGALGAYGAGTSGQSRSLAVGLSVGPLAAGWVGAVTLLLPARRGFTSRCDPRLRPSCTSCLPRLRPHRGDDGPAGSGAPPALAPVHPFPRLLGRVLLLHAALWSWPWPVSSAIPIAVRAVLQPFARTSTRRGLLDTSRLKCCLVFSACSSASPAPSSPRLTVVAVESCTDHVGQVVMMTLLGGRDLLRPVRGPCSLISRTGLSVSPSWPRHRPSPHLRPRPAMHLGDFIGAPLAPAHPRPEPVGPPSLARRTLHGGQVVSCPITASQHPSAAERMLGFYESGSGSARPRPAEHPGHPRYWMDCPLTPIST